MKRQLRAILPAFLFGSLFLLQIMACDCSAQSDSAPVPVQASGKVIFGPFEFVSPQGYWYFPRTYPEKGLTAGGTFVVTFFQTKDDIPTKRDKSEFPKHVFLNFYVYSSKFDDVQSYYDAVLSARRSRGISNDEFSYKDLPEKTKALFNNMPDWSCREETIKQLHPLFAINCVTLGEAGVIQMSAHGEEEKAVLAKASLLRDTMLSLKINRSGRLGN